MRRRTQTRQKFNQNADAQRNAGGKESQSKIVELFDENDTGIDLLARQSKKIFSVPNKDRKNL